MMMSLFGVTFFIVGKRYSMSTKSLFRKVGFKKLELWNGFFLYKG